MNEKSIKGEKATSIKFDDCKMPEKTETKPENAQTFGQFVKAKRLEKKYALRKFCNMLSMTPEQMEFWSQVEKGNLPYDSSIVTLEKISKLLKLTRKELNWLRRLAEVAANVKPKEDPIFDGSVVKTPYEKYMEKLGNEADRKYTLKQRKSDVKFTINVPSLSEEFEKALNDLKKLPLDKPANDSKRPPLGVTPEDIFEIQRIQELSRAIHECTDYYGLNLGKNLNIPKWAEELSRRLKNLKEIQQKDKKEITDNAAKFSKDSILFPESVYPTGMQWMHL